MKTGNRRYRLGGLVTGLLCFAAATAWGDDVDYGGSHASGIVGVHGGMAKAKDAKDGAALGGVHLEFLPASFFGIQGTVDYRSDERFDVTAGNTTAALHVRTIPVTASAKLYLPATPFSPYALAGAGWYHQLFDYSQDLENLGLRDRDVSTFGWHAGLGTNVNLTPRVGLMGEVRWIFLDPNRDFDTTTRSQIKNFDFDTTHWMAGLNFLF